MSWQDSFVPDAATPQAVQAQGWQSSFVPDSQIQQPNTQMPTNGTQAPANAIQPTANPSQQNDNNPVNQQATIPQQLIAWANSPTSVDLSDLPQSGEGLSLPQKLGAVLTAAGRGVAGAAEDTIAKPTAKGLAELLERSSGTNPPATEMQEGGPLAPLSPEAMQAVAMVSPVSRAAAVYGDALSGASKNALSKVGDALQDTVANEFDHLPAVVEKSIPSSSTEAKSIASQFYGKADASGGVLTPQFTNRFVDEAEKLAPQTEQGKAIAGETPITQLVGRMQALRDQPISLPAVQEIDEHLGNLIDQQYGIKGLSKEGKQILDLQSNLRGMINDAQQGDVAGGKEGFDALSDGRAAWSQAMKMQDIERIQARAQQSDNPATAIKSGVRTLLSNPSRIRGYTDDEIDALTNAGDRGVIGGALHVFGSRLVPFVATGLGEHIGGLEGAAAGGALGHAASTAARNAASKIQMNKLADVLSTMGGNIPQ